MTNPLLENTPLPQFAKIKAEHVVPAIDEILASCRAELDQILNVDHEFSWENLMVPLEELEDRLGRAWSPVRHLNSVVSRDDIRAAHDACLPKLAEYETEVGQNETLFAAIKQLSESDAFKKLDDGQQKSITDSLKGFKLSGVDLSPENKKRFMEIQQALSNLTSKFEEHVLDATDGWVLKVGDESDLIGIPDYAIKEAVKTAKQHDFDGWVFTLEMPSFHAVITYAAHRPLREQIYTAYFTRASDQGPNAGKWDNSDVMNKIMRLRYEEAKLLGFDNYSEMSLFMKMAENTSSVVDFLVDLAKRSYPMAQKEHEELQQFAGDQFDIENVEAWDVAFVSEKLKEDKYGISEEVLRPYFPENKVLEGMFNTVSRLYGIKITELNDVESWHEDARFFEIRDMDNNLRGQFYLDLYARGKKRGGAWMDECVSRRKLSDGSIQTPVAYLTCNLTPPVNSDPALFSHYEVLTVFHEFGHGLHHMLTKIDYASVSGINGVAWDAVELPSQFMENWCWQKDAIKIISGHYQTGEPLPDDMFDKMLAAKNFQSAMAMIRQLTFSLFDFQLHMEFDPESNNDFIQHILDEVRNEYAIIPVPNFNRFQNGFAHIFSGGYAAGYYSYKWAEVLSSDAFSKFEENGIFDEKTGREFLEIILEQGGSKEPMKLFVAFRGREPKIDALLKHCGIQ